MPVIFGFRIEAENTLAPVCIAGLVGRHFFAVKFDKKIAAPHPLFRPERIVDAVVDERGVRLNLALTIQDEIKRMVQAVACNSDFIALLSALNG